MNSVEQLVMEYINSISGEYECVEPQVYDIMLPKTVAERLQLNSQEGLSRIAFDAEAIADHPQAELLAFGHPTLDQILTSAHREGCVSTVYASGRNVRPHQLHTLLKSALQVSKEISVEFGSSRIVHVPLSFFWFQSTFSCDEKVQYFFEVGIDHYYGRIVRRLQDILDCAIISSEPVCPYPDMGGVAVLDAYLSARQEATLKLRGIAHAYAEKIANHLSQETKQIATYFTDMRRELEEKKKKTLEQGKDIETLNQQKRALDLEEEARILELRKKMALKVDLSLVQMLTVYQPKIITSMRILPKRGIACDVPIVWNPQIETVEPIACPSCQRPTLGIATGKTGKLACLQCQG